MLGSVKRAANAGKCFFASAVPFSCGGVSVVMGPLLFVSVAAPGIL